MTPYEARPISRTSSKMGMHLRDTAAMRRMAETPTDTTFEREMTCTHLKGLVPAYRMDMCRERRRSEELGPATVVSFFFCKGKDTRRRLSN